MWDLGSETLVSEQSVESGAPYLSQSEDYRGQRKVISLWAGNAARSGADLSGPHHSRKSLPSASWGPYLLFVG